MTTYKWKCIIPILTYEEIKVSRGQILAQDHTAGNGRAANGAGLTLSRAVVLIQGQF